MSKDVLSQEEIDRLMRESVNQEENLLSDTEKDIIGEVGNISMSTAATTLSSILNRRVLITTPRVSEVTFSQIIEECSVPKVVARIEFKSGLKGDNLLMMDIQDALIIADLMMGGQGDVEGREFTELELSAVGEAMNQMIGSASTSMATMLGGPIDILPPHVEVWNSSIKEEIQEMEEERRVCRISFNLDVEGLIKSEIMQVFTMETVEDVINIMLGPVEYKEEKLEEEVERVEKVAPVVHQQPKERYEEAIMAERQERSRVEEKVQVQKPIFPNLEEERQEVRPPRNLDLIMDVPLEFSVVLGKSKKTIQEILSFGNGSIVELDKLADEPLEIYVNGKLIAHGEVVVINENFGVRITNILSKEQRVKNL